MLLDIPLPDNSVDLMVLNGVLEWVAINDFHQKPGSLGLGSVILVGENDLFTLLDTGNDVRSIGASRLWQSCADCFI